MNKIPKTNNENNMLKALKNAENQAFENLYREYYRMVEQIILRNHGSLEDAQDIFQESLIVLVKNLHKNDFILTAKIGTYLYSIARNLWLYRLKSSKNMRKVEIKDSDVNYLVLEEEEIVRKKVNEKRYEIMADQLATLKKDCQKIIIESSKKGRPLKDIAEEMGYTSSFIRVKKNRCMNEYRKRVLRAMSAYENATE